MARSYPCLSASDDGIYTFFRPTLYGYCFSHPSACAALNSAAVKPRSSPFLTQRYSFSVLYIELKTRFDTAYQEQSSRLNQLSVELVRLNRMLSNENKWLVNIRNIRKARKLTPEIAQAMIDHINVYKTGYAQHRLEIIFRFQEERDALETAYHELEGGEAR